MKSVNTDVYRCRISRVVDDIMAKEDIFREQLNRNILIANLTVLLRTFPPETFQTMNEHDLYRRVGLLMSDELVADLLDKESIRLALMPEFVA